MLKNGAKQLGIELSTEQIEKFDSFFALISEYNKCFNLTRITDETDVIIKHFLDSLTCNEYIAKNSSVIDIGTGAGFPSIPLSIIRPDCTFCLVDSLQKRIAFLNTVKNALALENCICIHSRAEDIGKLPEHREKYDYALSRAVANLNILTEYCLPLVNKAGAMIAMKGKDIAVELSDANVTISALGGAAPRVNLHTLPFSDITHSIIIINKKRKTPMRFPRINKQIGTTIQ